MGIRLQNILKIQGTCDSMNDEDVKRCMAYLKNFHNLKLRVEHEFDLFGQIEYLCESLWGQEKSAYRDYQTTKEHVYRLKIILTDNPRNGR